MLTVWIGLVSLFKEDTPFSREFLKFKFLFLVILMLLLKLEIYGITVIGGAGKNKHTFYIDPRF